jgi:hypothetical protein
MDEPEIEEEASDKASSSSADSRAGAGCGEIVAGSAAAESGMEEEGAGSS